MSLEKSRTGIWMVTGRTTHLNDDDDYENDKDKQVIQIMMMVMILMIIHPENNKRIL